MRKEARDGGGAGSAGGGGGRERRVSILKRHLPKGILN